MSDVLDAQFRESLPLAPRESGAIMPPERADAMVEKLREWERFKALAIREEDWIQIPGVQGKYLPADAIDRIAPAIGLSWEIISKNEHGDPGVRCAIVEALTYATKTVKKPARGGGTYEAQVPDKTQPIKTLAALYTVTVRCRDSFGRQVEIEGSFSSLEMEKSDYHARQQALGRARRTGSLKLVGGIDYDVFEEERARIDYEKRAAAQHAGGIPTPVQLYHRAKACGKATDGQSFRAWVAATVPGCAHVATADWQPNVTEREAIAKVLAEIERQSA